MKLLRLAVPCWRKVWVKVLTIPGNGTMFRDIQTCYGSGQWERIDYGDAEAASDGQTQSHEAVRLGRYLSITTNYGNIIDG
jgi:hypothetical protein